MGSGTPGLTDHGRVGVAVVVNAADQHADGSGSIPKNVEIITSPIPTANCVARVQLLDRGQSSMASNIKRPADALIRTAGPINDRGVTSRGPVNWTDVPMTTRNGR